MTAYSTSDLESVVKASSKWLSKALELLSEFISSFTNYVNLTIEKQVNPKKKNSKLKKSKKVKKNKKGADNDDNI